MPGAIPQTFIDDLLSRADIVDVIGRRVPLKKAGREFKACCPFHDEKTPSFTVSPVKQFYHCFGCGAHGTAIGFLMEYEHLDFVDAIETLAAEYHVEVPREDAPAGTIYVDGVDIRIIQILLGHSSLRSTEIYTHLTEPLRDQLRKVLTQTTDGLFQGRRPRHG